MRTSPMGVFSVHIRVANPQDQTEWREVELVVDTGATLTKLPGDLLQELRIEPQFSVPALTSDGRLVTRAVGQAWVSLDGRAGIIPVAYGDRGEPVLLGATTLEILGFTVDPIEQKLLPRPLREK
jgi:predicted aspartyl protease